MSDKDDKGLFKNFSSSLGDNEPSSNEPSSIEPTHHDPTVEEVVQQKIEKSDPINKRHENDLNDAQIKQAKLSNSPLAITEKYRSEVMLTGALLEYEKELDKTGSPIRERDEQGNFHDKLLLDKNGSYVIKSQVKWDENIEMDVKRGLEAYDTLAATVNQRQSFSTQQLLDDVGINKLYHAVIQDALSSQDISDLEIVQYEHFGLVRYSKGPNDWYNQRLIYKSSVDPLITLIKHKAGMKIEKRNSKSPQTNGKLVYDDVNFRLATGANQYGMFVVMRRQGSHFNSLDELDFPDEIKSEFRKAIAGKDGLTIVGGPVGSGKTTLMTTGLIERLATTNGSQNILSLEKPIETPTPGIIQQEINDDYGLTWSTAIQAALREMPTILRVGEVNEQPAAQAIVRGANSGVVALTTMHIRSTLEVFETLKDYQISENEIKNSLRLVIYLNRVRRLCPYCRKVESILTNIEVSDWADKVLHDGKTGALTEFAVRNPNGCEICRRNQTKPELYGTLGSVGIYELLKVNKPLLRIWRRYADDDLYVLKDKLLHPDTIRLYNKDAVNDNDKYVKMDDASLSGLLYVPIERDVLAKLQSFDIDIETAKYLMNN